MRCIALLSGGKDSVAAIEIAQRHGWDVVAALRMVPDEDDAYMFHTPNLHVVEAVAACLGVPLVTAAARANPLQEVSDLQQALAKTAPDFEADAIISGALASEYQRTRIDRIGHKLGLQTFAPLWHKDPDGYMQSLLDARYGIRFSRVAADGLDESWAGSELDHARLDSLRTKRLHVAGEGGEYETLVLDAPNFSQRIVVDAAHVEATASRSTWHVDEFHLESK
jgi:diphthine-ammonia ligase